MEFCHFVKVGTHKSGSTIQANWSQCSVTVHPLALKLSALLQPPKTLHLTHCNTLDILDRVQSTAVISFPRTAPHCFIKFHLMNNFFMRSFQCQGWLRSNEKILDLFPICCRGVRSPSLYLVGRLHGRIVHDFTG